MKFITVAAIIVVLAFVATSEAGLIQPQKIQFQRVIASTSGKPCKCIPWRECHGEVNSDVYCQPWYGMACCVIPEPEQRAGDVENDVRVLHV